MSSLKVAACFAASLFIAPCLPAHADNAMGYRLLSTQEAATLPRNHGAVGLEVASAQQSSGGGMTFDIIRIKQVRPNTASARAGLKAGDEIIALDGRVFPTLHAFAAYIQAARPGDQMIVDYMPAGGGPQQSQRVTLTVDMAAQTGQGMPQPEVKKSTGMSTGEKVAIGAGAVALLGCYEAGCFSHHTRPASVQPPVQQPNGTQTQ